MLFSKYFDGLFYKLHHSFLNSFGKITNNYKLNGKINGITVFVKIEFSFHRDTKINNCNDVKFSLTLPFFIHQ
jgi:hypothetical protein